MKFLCNKPIININHLKFKKSYNKDMKYKGNKDLLLLKLIIFIFIMS